MRGIGVIVPIDSDAIVPTVFGVIPNPLTSERQVVLIDLRVLLDLL